MNMATSVITGVISLAIFGFAYYQRMKEQSPTQSQVTSLSSLSEEIEKIKSYLVPRATFFIENSMLYFLTNNMGWQPVAGTGIDEYYNNISEESINSILDNIANCSKSITIFAKSENMQKADNLLNILKTTMLDAGITLSFSNVKKENIIYINLSDLVE